MDVVVIVIVVAYVVVVVVVIVVVVVVVSFSPCLFDLLHKVQMLQDTSGQSYGVVVCLQ